MDRAHACSGDLLLGMNAHVNRDLPFALYSIGLVTPKGSSRKPDHDKVNVFLNSVVEPLFEEAAARYDPTVDDTQINGTQLDSTANEIEPIRYPAMTKTIAASMRASVE